MVEASENRNGLSRVDQPVADGLPYAFARYLPQLAEAMGNFAETTGIFEFGGGQDRRGTACWPMNLPKPTEVEDQPGCCD